MKRHILWNARAVLLAPLVWVKMAAHSQTVEGQINGTVTDTSGSTLSNAAIALKNLDTGAERTTVSGASGVYFLASISPGRYLPTVSVKGFKAYEVSQITLLVNQAQTVDAQLAPGAVTQTVEVNAGAVVLNTTDTTIGTVVGHQDVVTMPLNGRNFTGLIPWDMYSTQWDVRGRSTPFLSAA